MTDNEYQTTVYQPPTLRIAATYPVPQDGERSALPPGHPDNVEIELHLDAEHQANGVTEFVVAIVSSLFRYGAEVPTVSVDDQPTGLTASSKFDQVWGADADPDATLKPWISSTAPRTEAA